MADSEQLFTRYSQNPILTAEDIPYIAHTVFNAGATRFGGETLLLVRVEDRTGLSHLTRATSQDGLTGWDVDSRPTFSPEPESYPEELWGVEDPRITYLEEREEWAIMYTAFSSAGPLVSLATTKDFKTFQRFGALTPPENKDAALFPIRFGNRWAMIHRPVGVHGIGAHIWLAFSPDLRHWGDHCLIIRARQGGWWDANKIGLSPPPLRTPEGWLLLYHGVRTTASGSIYRLGLALLDLENPCRMVARSNQWIFAPEEPYEIVGDVDKVVFPCGWILEGDRVRMYYGGADTCIAVADASLSDLLDWLRNHNAMET